VTKYLEKNRENGRSATTPYTYLAHPHIGSFHFLYRGAPIETMNNTVWQQARVRAGLRKCAFTISSTRLGRRAHHDALLGG